MSDYIRRHTRTPWDEDDDDLAGLTQARDYPVSIGWKTCFAFAIATIAVLGTAAGLLMFVGTVALALWRGLS